MKTIYRIACIAMLCLSLLGVSQTASAAGVKLGLEISVDGEGAFWNPVVKRIDVTGVAPDSLSARAGIAKGDEIVAIEGQAVKGRRARDLKPYLDFAPGETRTMDIKRPGGEMVNVKLTKPMN